MAEDHFVLADKCEGGVALSGASGFVGSAVLKTLEAGGAEITCLSRAAPSGGARTATSRDLLVADDFANLEQVWPSALRPHCVIHLAARVHIMRDTAADALDAHRATNVTGTMRLAEAAVRAGVKRFIFVSSIKALGEGEGDRGRPLREDDAAKPVDPYGISKYEAERALFEFGKQNGLEVVVIRPPLVYGPGVRANFLSLFSAVAKGVPLPLGFADGPRSLVAVDNLTSAIIECIHHPNAAHEVFHVADGEDVSVAQLTRMMGKALGRHARLLPVPIALLRAAGALTGRSEAIQRLVEPLRVDIAKIRTLLGWRPPLSLTDGLARTAKWYRSTYGA